MTVLELVKMYEHKVINEVHAFTPEDARQVGLIEAIREVSRDVLTAYLAENENEKH